MADAAEVAIESALINRLVAFCASPAIPLALPNIDDFTPPVMSPSSYYLEAHFLPADSFALGVDYGADIQHYGIFQVSVFHGLGAGEYAPARIAANVIAYFKRGTRLTKDGFVVDVFKAPFRGRMQKEPDRVMIPVSIPYIAFAPNPA
jgi:hypothetical protein